MRQGYRILHFFILIICLILQITIGEYLKLYYINFDLIMIAIVCITLIDGFLFGMFSGFFFGLVVDLMVGNIIGISAFMYAVDSFIANRLTEVGFKRKILSYIFIIFIITEINLIVVSLIRYIFNFNIDILELGMEMLIRPVFNIVLLFAISPIIRIGSERVGKFGFNYKEKA